MKNFISKLHARGRGSRQPRTVRWGSLLSLSAVVVVLFLWGAAGAHAALTDGPIELVPPGDPSGDGFANESSSTQGGAHADTVTRFRVGPTPTVQEFGVLGHALRNAVVDLPVGAAGNPNAAEKCSLAQFNPDGNDTHCPQGSQVGYVRVWSRLETEKGVFFQRHLTNSALYLLQTSENRLADLVFKVVNASVHIEAVLRPDDYGLRFVTRNISNSSIVSLWGVDVHVWGVPADSSHDEQRCAQPGLAADLCDDPFDPVNENGPHAAGIEPLPFLSNPTSCDEERVTSIRVESWFDPNQFDTAADTDPIPTGCDQLDFNPTITANPTTNAADAPSGLDFNLHIPQNEDPDGLAASHLKDAVVTFPKGLVVNPSSANGLGACSEGQIGIGVDAPNACPDASKLGTVSIETPVLDKPVLGAIYLAEQNRNPFGSLIALYMAAKLPNGQEVKLAGRADADSQTGQITAVFKNNPQLPFEDLHVSLFGGAGASLRTPTACGTFTTNATLTPWAAPELSDAFPTDSFQITQGAGGGACVSPEDKAPHQPSFAAGAVDPTAGAFTPFVLKLARQDGSQPIKAIDTALPKGLLAKLAGVPYCPDSALASAAGKSGKSEQSSSSCLAASQVGSVNVAAGAGPAPLNVGGKAYLAGPYKGAPLSLAVITPAVAGPFDLGTVVVRAALNIDPATAQVHAVSDEVPTILQGIPLDIRSISLDLAKPQFTLNPTSCDPMQITGSALSAFGQSAALSNPFQVGDCGRLAFKPKLAIRLKGGAKRDDNPALTATLTYLKGPYANVKSASVALPRSEFLDQSHIRTVCTRVQYAVGQCPPGSVYGFARAVTPLLEKPLEGPVYLRSSSNPLPDLVAALKGQVSFDLAGRIDSVKGGGIRTTFEGVPDAPVSKFTLMMKGGKKGLLVNSRDICKRAYRATASFVGQNGKSYESQPVLKSSACGKGRKHKGHRKHKRG